MGAVFNEKTFPAMSEAKLKTAFQAHLKSLRSQFGSDSSNGTWTTNEGLSIVRDGNGDVKIFQTESDALDWLSENAEKREAVLAVQVIDSGGSGGSGKAGESDQKLSTTAQKKRTNAPSKASAYWVLGGLSAF